jgi:hypothetical protein
LGRRLNEWITNVDLVPDDQFFLDRNFTQDEVDQLRGGYAAAKKLYDIAHGLDDQPVADNLFFHLQHFTGTVV